MGECILGFCFWFVHLNGILSAGKSTLLSVVAGITGITSGTVTFSGGTPRAPPGTLGIVPQKNVLFPELSCLQTLRVWKAVKCLENRQSHRSETEEDLVALLRDCDLGGKINDRASTLSGGQKRKLQLAIGLVGGSNSRSLSLPTRSFSDFKNSPACG